MSSRIRTVIQADNQKTISAFNFPKYAKKTDLQGQGNVFDNDLFGLGGFDDGSLDADFAQLGTATGDFSTPNLGEVNLDQDKERQELTQQAIEKGTQEGFNQGLQQGMSEGFKQGHEKGIQQGLKDGASKAKLAIESSLTPVHTIGQQLQLAMNTHLSQQGQLLCDLVEQVARKVIKAELAHDETLLLELIGEAMMDVEDHQKINIFLATETIQKLNAMGIDTINDWPLHADDDVPVNDCRIETAQAEVTMDQEQRLQTIMAQLRQSLAEAAPSDTHMEAPNGGNTEQANTLDNDD